MRKLLLILSVFIATSVLAGAALEAGSSLQNLSFAPSNGGLVPLKGGNTSPRLKLKKAAIGYYSLPAGVFSTGVSEDLENDTLLHGIAPAFVNTLWKSSSSYATSYEWNYVNPLAVESFITNTDSVLNLAYANGKYAMPSLKASNSFSDSTFTWGKYLQYGGKVDKFGATNMSMQRGIGLKYLGFNTGHPVFWYGTGQDFLAVYGREYDVQWSTIFPEYGYERLMAIGNFFAKPAQPYKLKRMWITSFMDADSDAEVTLTLMKAKKICGKGDWAHSATDSVEFGDTLAVLHSLYKNATTETAKIQGNTMKWASIPFDFTGIDSTGLLIDSGIFAKLDGWRGNSKVKYFGAVSQAYPSVDTKETNAYLFFNLVSKTALFDTISVVNPAYIGNFKVVNGDTVMSEGFGLDHGDGTSHDMETEYISFLFNMDVDYPFIGANADGKNMISLDKEGTAKAMTFYSSTPIDKIRSSLLPTWLSMNTEAVAGAKETYTATFSAKENTEADSRICDVTLTGETGQKCVFHVTQLGTSGVKANLVNGGVKVAVVNGNFNVTYPDNVNGVKVYNIAGQLVKDAALDGNGNSVIAAQNLAHGIYILRFTNGATLKTAK
jgi:hypothetical protein